MNWIAMGVLLFAGGIFHFLPQMSRKLFGVRVSAAVRQSEEAKGMVRRYQRANQWAIFFTAFAIGQVTTDRWLPWLLGAQIAVAMALLIRMRQQALRFALPSDRIHTTSLGLKAPEIPYAWLATAIPVLLIAGTALYLSRHWDQIPQRFPIHYNLWGEADRWGQKSEKLVYGLLIFGVLLEGLLGFLAYGLITGTRRVRPGSPSLKMLTANAILLLLIQLHLGVLIAYMGLQPLMAHSPAGWVIALFIGVLFALIAAFVIYLVKLQAAPDDSPDNTPDAAWRWGGMVYFNREDPALLVERRLGIGYTLNFGHALSWPFIGLVSLVTLLPIYLFR